MSNYAFRNKNFKGQLMNPISANQAQTNNISRSYYCPNANCSAYLYVCSRHGSTDAYFAATHADHRHIPNCPYGHNINFD